MRDVALYQRSLPRAQRRDQRRRRAEVVAQADLAQLRVSAIGHVTRRALLETGDLNVMRRAAEQLCPEADELTTMIAVAAAVKMTEIITDLDGPW